MGVTTTGERASSGKAAPGVFALVAVACLAFSACTAGGGATDMGGPTSAPGDAPAAGTGTEPGDAAGPATGNATGGPAGAAPVLPPPTRPPAPAVESGAEAALAMMPGLYGLVHLRTEVLDDRITFEADADCDTVLDILQSGQWALEVRDDGDLGGAVAGESDSAAEGAEDAVTRTATLRLGDDVAQVQLSEFGAVCSGAIEPPAG